MRTDKAERLLRRYPVLAPVPPAERPAIVRRALMQPLVLALVLGVGFLLVPPYARFTMDILHIESEASPIFLMAKLGCIVILPVALLSFALTRWIMPPAIKKIMRGKGYDI